VAVFRAICRTGLEEEGDVQLATHVSCQETSGAEEPGVRGG